VRRPGPLFALVCEGFFSRLAFGLISFALPLYARSLGLSIAAIGILASLATIVSLVLKPVLGGLADRMGLRRTLLAALTLRSVLSLGYALVAVPWQLYAVRGLHGVSDSLRDPAVTALIAENGGKKAVASAFAWYQTAKTTAGAVGKSVAGVLLTVAAGGFGLTFGVAFGLSLLPAVAVLLLVPRDSSTAHPMRATEVVEAPSSPAPPTSRPPVARYATLGFLVAGASSMLTSLFPILATEYAGLTTAQAGALYLITPLLAFTGPLWGLLADRVSRPLVLSVRGVANTVSALIYLFAPNLAGMWVGKSLDDLGKAAFRPAWGSLMADLSSQDRRKRARIMGYLSAGEDAGDVAAPILAGLLWTGFGVPAVLLGRVALAVLAEGYTLWLEHRAPIRGRGRHRRRRTHGPAPELPRRPQVPGGSHGAHGLHRADGRVDGAFSTDAPEALGNRPDGRAPTSTGSRGRPTRAASRHRRVTGE
jgi:MFS family permease